MLSPSDFNNAVPQFTNGNYASNPINPQYIAEPDAVSYNRGAEPLQTLPAQWWNWFLNKFTGRFNKVNVYVKNIFNELAQLLSLVNITPDGTEATPTTGQLKSAFQTEYPKYLALLMYPIGSIYWTGKAPDDGGDPNVLFGGTWVQIKGKFVWAKGDSDTLNASGGSKTVTLTTDNMPSHTHTFTPIAHSHTFSSSPHSHTFTGSAVTSGGGGVDHTHGINHDHYTGGNTGYISADHSHSGNTGTESAHESFSGSQTHTHNIYTGAQGGYGTNCDSLRDPTRPSMVFGGYNELGTKGYVTSSGAAGGPNYIESTTVTISGTCYGDHYHSFSTGGVSANHYHSWGAWSSTPRYVGNEGVERLSSDGASAYWHTHSVTASGSNSSEYVSGSISSELASGTNSSVGGGTAHDNMPPYVVKYCWERTA